MRKSSSSCNSVQCLLSVAACALSTPSLTYQSTNFTALPQKNTPRKRYSTSSPSSRRLPSSNLTPTRIRVSQSGRSVCIDSVLYAAVLYRPDFVYLSVRLYVSPSVLYGTLAQKQKHVEIPKLASRFKRSQG